MTTPLLVTKAAGMGIRRVGNKHLVGSQDRHCLSLWLLCSGKDQALCKIQRIHTFLGFFWKGNKQWLLPYCT